MARFWLHGHHLLVGGRKMSKSRGTVYYTGDLIEQGYTAAEIRFFLIYGHYREKLSFSNKDMKLAAEKLRRLHAQVREIERRVKGPAPLEDDRSRGIRKAFRDHMDQDLEVRSAFDSLFHELEAANPGNLKPAAAAAMIAVLREIDRVLNVIF
jgi:cysteinyl-tRNA synthetase